MKRYNIGEITDEKVEYIYVIIENNGKFLLKKYENKKMNCIFEKKAQKENLIKELNKMNLKTIPLHIYEIENNIYCKVYYCYNNDEEIKINDQYKLIEKKEVKEYLDKEFYEMFKESITSRRVINKWYIQDTRKTIGRTNFIKIGENKKYFKEGIADPINIIETLKIYYKLNKLKGPIQLDVNPLSICCDKCVFCFNEEDRREDLEKLNYEKALESIKWLIENTNLMHIKCSGFGEPTLYPDIWNLFEYTRKQGLYNTLNTNGFKLENHIDNILKTMDSIRFSIDAYNSESFKKVHNKDDFDKRLYNIEKLVKRREKEQEDLIIGLHYVLLPQNYKGLDQIIIWAKEVGVDYIDITLGKFKPTYLNNWKEQELEDAIKIMYNAKKYIDDKFNVILPHKETLDEKDLEEFRKKRYNGNKCWQIYLRQYITPKGEYGACNAFDSQPISKRVFGNIYKDSMVDIFSRINEDNKVCKKNKECKYCVIPHGAFNDLCDTIYNLAIQENNNIL